MGAENVITLLFRDEMSEKRRCGSGHKSSGSRRECAPKTGGVYLAKPTEAVAAAAAARA